MGGRESAQYNEKWGLTEGNSQQMLAKVLSRALCNI
jgi:hypothetical protein